MIRMPLMLNYFVEHCRDSLKNRDFRLHLLDS